MRLRIDHPDTTPSAQVLEGCREHGGLVPYTLALSRQNQQSLLAQPFDDEKQARFSATARTSLEEQKALEARPQVSFEEYVAHYYA